MSSWDYSIEFKTGSEIEADALSRLPLPNQTNVDSILKPYSVKRNELPVEGDCIMQGVGGVITEIFEDKVLEILHSDHWGMMK